MKKVVLAFLIVCLLVIGGYFLINEGFLKQQEPVKEAPTKLVRMKPETEKPSKEDTPIKVGTPLVKSVEEPTQITVTDPTQNGAPQNELTQEEIAKAKEIIKWLKENGYTVSQYNDYFYRVSKRNGPVGISEEPLGVVSVGEVMLKSLVEANKVVLTVKNIGTATFTFDANGELQPAK
ncbi:hypothetical protein F4Y93_01635 [Candidatus Poribacteria bacterium]|nr:hypothetical protein [Candidatus Poribacteria bacterium]